MVEMLRRFGRYVLFVVHYSIFGGLGPEADYTVISFASAYHLRFWGIYMYLGYDLELRFLRDDFFT